MPKLTDWLGLGRKPGDIVLPDWLGDDLPDDPTEAAETIRRKLPERLEKMTDDRDRIALIEATYERARRIVAPIELRLESAPRPLPADLRPQAMAADQLLKAIAASYFALVTAARAKNLRAQEHGAIPQALQRSMECMTRRQQLAFRASAPPSSNTWQLIHETYAYARHQNLTAFSSGGCSIEHEYLFALLLSWADPARFSRDEFPDLLDCLIHYAPLARIGLIGSDSSPFGERAPVFLVVDTDPHSGRRLDNPVRSVKGRAGWIVDCRPLVAALHKAIAEREQGNEPAADEPPTPLPMLRAIVAHLCEFPTSRSVRKAAKPGPEGK